MMKKDKMDVITKEQYKKGWKKDLKKDFVVIRHDVKRDTYIPQKTFMTDKEARAWIRKKK